jgi:hypothetical protein
MIEKNVPTISDASDIDMNIFLSDICKKYDIIRQSKFL